ncbi:hypothetical protein ZIOFF_002462 [Zingiber officinale]|uniref:RNase H type-1 domain-containing protein n=1 Tax=Zingiber officinale TaxID=94328 RepID=A0A8J5HZV3_ZINOF|nr:hypothetical protein ZIOFF_002462 [Zingiber officinale]
MSRLYCGDASPCVVSLKKNASPYWRRFVKLRNYGENNIGWNVDKLQSCVPEQIVDEIKEVALPGGISGEVENVDEAVQNGVRDCIVWKPSLDGKKHLPMDEVLQRRGVYLASKCYCCDFVESWDHLFYHGAIALEVWRYFAQLFGVDRFLVFENWRSGQYWSYGGHIREAIPFLIIWFLWCARNDAKHRGIRIVAKKIIWNVSQYVITGISAGIIKPGHWKGFIMAAQNMGLLVKPRTVNTISVVTWKKPKVGWFKLNTDGCSKGNLGLSSFGVIIRDHSGNVMMVKYGLIGRGSNVRVELMAILKGLELCVEKQFFPIWLESDSLIALKIISASYFSWEWRNLMRKIKCIICRYQVWFSHVYREANAAADQIVNQAFISLDDGLNAPLDQYTERICYNHEIDKGLRGICNLDKSGLPYIRLSSKPVADARLRVEKLRFYGAEVVVEFLSFCC